jgi:pyruvate dehydrogenase E2 component (dihydrolipoamide acetyltransferase)
MADIVMPRLSDTMEEGTILRWLKQDGDVLERGDELVEIETDKATMTYESDQAGVLHLLAAEGDTLNVGEPIASVGEATGDGSAPAERASAQGNGHAAQEPAAPAPAPVQEAVAPAAAPAPPAPAAAPANGDAGGERVKASPLARRMARERGVDLRALSGSGPGGRIVKADVEGAQAGAVPGPTLASGAGGVAGVAGAKGETTSVALNRMQQAIARRMAESKATIPDFTLQVDVDMEECVRLRAELKRITGGDGQPTPTYNDMVVKASALALREFPRANSSYRDGQLLMHGRVNVGVAVAAHEALVVPTVFDADTKALGEIAREARTLAARVRDGSVTPPELGGGTFTVSNLGMYGIRNFAAIINPPQAAILAVGALEPRAVPHEGGIAVRSRLTLTLACDHRVLYGAEAAQFLARIRELLERPTALAL